jgi:hypothetical protein
VCYKERFCFSVNEGSPLEEQGLALDAEKAAT